MSLLADVVIFPELEQALECKSREPALAMATLGGEYISRQGIVFTGSSEVRAASLLERKAQIADLVKEDAALAKECDLVGVRRDEAKTALETASRLRGELSEIGRKIETLQSEKTALDRQIAAADERITDVERDLQTGRDQLANQKTELSAFEAAQKQTVLHAAELDASSFDDRFIGESGSSVERSPIARSEARPRPLHPARARACIGGKPGGSGEIHWQPRGAIKFNRRRNRCGSRRRNHVHPWRAKIFTALLACLRSSRAPFSRFRGRAPLQAIAAAVRGAARNRAGTSRNA